MTTTTFVPGYGQGLKRVNLEGRAFYVKLAPDGSPQAIKERRSVAGRLGNHTYWHRSHGLPKAKGRGTGPRAGRPRTIVVEVLLRAGAALPVDNRQNAGH